jgi:hypothetical protein
MTSHMRGCLAMFLFFIAGLGAAQSRVQVYGRTQEATTGKPVYCSVEVFNSAGQLRALATTNEEGRYSFFIVSDSLWELRVNEDGYLPFCLALPPLVEATPTRELDLLLMPMRTGNE